MSSTQGARAPSADEYGAGIRQIRWGDPDPAVCEIEPYVSDEPARIYFLDGTLAGEFRPTITPSRREIRGTHRRPSRRRESHRGRRGHRRVRSTRAGPDEPAPSDEPALALAANREAVA